MAYERLLTVGVYGFDADSFFAALEGVGVDAVWDVRQRRAVRGADYAFANAKRLERRLAEAGVGYAHLTELAPSAELRGFLQDLDRQAGVRHRTRTTLPAPFVERYRAEVLDPVDLTEVAASAGEAARPALLCVEGVPEACHRSLAAAALAEALGVRVTHLRAGG